MWWNFVGRSHADIAAYRRLWEDHDIRFGAVDGYRGSVDRLPAPPLPNATLRPRPRALLGGELRERECGSHRVGNERVG